MVSRGLLATVGLCLFATLVAATQIADVSSNYYAGRSGPIMITGQQPTFRDSHAVLLDSSRTLQSTHIPSSLPLTSLAHVIAQFMGLSEKIGAETSEAQQLTSALDSTKKQPKAQVIFNVESVGKSTIDRFQLAQLANPSTPHVSFGLSSPSITPPAASISIATSVATGSPIASHGIVGQRWKTPSGAVASAFTRSNPKETFAAVSNLADLVATHTNGRGLTISASGAENLAWSFGVNKALADARRADGWTNNYCLAMVHDTVFESVSTNSAPALQFQVSSLEKQITSSPMSIINNLGSNMHATVANHVVTLTYIGKDGKSESVNFDLKQKADTFFLAELQYALDLPSKLKSVAQLHSALQDDEQDLIVFSFAGFTKLIEKYGRESEQFRGGLKMFTQLFPLLASQYASLFESHPTASTMQTIVFLGAHPTVLEKQDPRQVEALLKADNVKNTEFYPHVYVSTREVEKVCAKLNKDLAPLKYSAYCPSTVAGHMLVESASSIPKRTLAAGEPSGDVNPDYYFPTDDEIGRYQIALWLSIIMTLIAIGAIYSLAYMPFKKDTMLYSSFNPNWEDRKRR